MAKGKGWPVIGKIVENTSKSGDKFRTVKFEENVTILVDGKEIDMNKYRSANLVCPVDEVNRLIAGGFIEEKDQEFRLSKAQEVKDWLKYNIVVPPQ